MKLKPLFSIEKRDFFLEEGGVRVPANKRRGEPRKRRRRRRREDCISRLTKAGKAFEMHSPVPLNSRKRYIYTHRGFYFL